MQEEAHGGYLSSYFSVNPGDVYEVVVGAVGAGYRYYAGTPVAATSGFVLIAYGGDI